MEDNKTTQPESEEKVTFGEFKGKPMIQLPTGKGKNGEVFNFSFGITKAKTIVKYFEDIKKFVENNSK